MALARLRIGRVIAVRAEYLLPRGRISPSREEYESQAENVADKGITPIFRAFLRQANVYEQSCLLVAMLPLSLPLLPLSETENPLSIKD